MNRVQQIYPVSFEDFEILLESAQQKHAEYGEPIPNMGVDNIEKVKSCLSTPFLSYENIPYYRGFKAKAANLFYLFIKNHPLINGNKRMAILVLTFFMVTMVEDLKFTNDEIYSFAKSIAKADDKYKDKSIKKILAFLRHSFEKNRKLSLSNTDIVKRYTRHMQKSSIRKSVFKTKLMSRIRKLFP